MGETFLCLFVKFSPAASSIARLHLQDGFLFRILA